MSQQSAKFSREEPLPGYATTDLLGRGGFGEVWKAVAPGGVAKAIKLVYGDDPKRAELELRSLNRIKDVRHPLILSIDRIEIVKGTLVIVTELGDCNLKELCVKFRGQGQAGVPQKQLLKLMHDASEALDFIYAEHSLQHLDVKPENFLVFGKHLKIADFGVVKHIYERSASLVHGLTPVYAPPELFDGKANRHTDQYSLAIVYQEMLTGQLPFDGLSPARLATQHLLEPPNLLSLPAAQQPVFARAWALDPHPR
jgi:serine/threonine protein kinase